MKWGVLFLSLSSLSALAAPVSGEASAPLNQLYGQSLDGCLNNLSMLKSFSQPRYNQLSSVLNSEISRVTRYLVVRDKLSSDMQPVMDKVYQARLVSHCQSIHNALFDAVLSQANGCVDCGKGGRE